MTQPLLQSTPPCCTGWTEIAPALTWFPVGGFDGIWTLPHIGTKPVRFCPCCGKRVGQFILNIHDDGLQP